MAQEAPPFAFRRQTEADPGAVRWNLLAWEAPWLERLGAPFWTDVAMFEARAVDAGEDTARTLRLRRVVVRSGATFWGLRLRDGGLVVRVERERRVAQTSQLVVKELREESATLRRHLSQLAALVDHYFAAWSESQILLKRRERELAALRRSGSRSLSSVRLESAYTDTK